MKMKSRYKLNKAASTGEKLICPSCGTSFEKTHYQQVFCKTKPGTVCKDKYWNTVTPGKRNNTTRISPASAMYMERMKEYRDETHDPDDDAHPFSSYGLGQWDDCW